MPLAVSYCALYVWLTRVLLFPLPAITTLFFSGTELATGPVWQ